MVEKKAKKKTPSPVENTQEAASSSTAKAATPYVVTMVPIKKLRRSGWNPNKMTDEGYAEYLGEVKLQRKLSKPVVVFENKSGYVIVDGEHGYRAVKELGFAEVPCEIIDVDPFEAMRQTIVRNRHGENDPVLLGRLFGDMLKERELTNRNLASELHITEGTVRHYLDYVKAAELRNSYAPTDADAMIAKLTFRQVQAYLSLPADKRDEWLDIRAISHTPLVRIRFGIGRWPRKKYFERQPMTDLDDLPRTSYPNNT